MDNRHHLVVAALREEHPRTMGTDKGYDTKGVVRFMGWLGVTPHVAQTINRTGGNERRGIEKVFG